MKTLGVIGGMGPAATFDFCARLTAAMPAKRDQDHPRILVDCDPAVPDRNAAQRGEGASPGDYLAAMARGLVANGAHMLAMPCNSAHAYRAEIAAAAPGLFIDMIFAAASEAAATGAVRAGVLAADGCLAAGLYQDALTKRGLEPLTLPAPAQERFMALIYRIKAGASGSPERAEIAALAEILAAQGAELVIAGCTEAPLVLQAADVRVPLISSTEALVRATIARLTAPG